MLANLSWRVWTAQKQSANTLANCLRQIERVCRLFLRRSHAPTWVCQHEFANFSLPCEGCLKHSQFTFSTCWVIFVSKNFPPPQKNNGAPLLGLPNSIYYFSLNDTFQLSTFDSWFRPWKNSRELISIIFAPFRVGWANSCVIAIQLQGFIS